MVRGVIYLSACVFALPASAQVTPAGVRAHIPRLEKALTENILGFWLPRSLDAEHGGYIISFGPGGERKDPVTKGLVTQARNVWLFSRAARAGYGDRGQLLSAAAHGYRFLRDKLWDQQYGGFYWEVDVTGDKVLRPRKHLYGQTFGLYALSEYAMASGSKEALDFATRFFELLEAKAHDPVYGGYLEAFERDWTPQRGPERSYMGDPALKLLNTHLHMLECVTAYYRASRSPLARERLHELIGIATNAVIRKKLTAGTDKYDRDWTPRLEGDYSRISYGHDLEGIWLVAEACDALKAPVHPYVDLFRELFAYSLKHGYDHEHGGFWYTGLPNQPADQLTKSWWVQSETMVGALYLYRITKDPQYLEVFDQTWRFVDRYQIDWQNGEWWASVGKDLVGRGDKANIWKAGYHNGRAMIECLAILKGLGE